MSLFLKVVPLSGFSLHIPSPFQRELHAHTTTAFRVPWVTGVTL
jgi:hypothetical protein